MREEDVKFTEVEQTLTRMSQLENLELGISYGVSLKWYSRFQNGCPNGK